MANIKTSSEFWKHIQDKKAISSQVKCSHDFEERIKEWEAKTRDITLSNPEFTCLMTCVDYFEKECKIQISHWEEAAKEKNPDGSAKYKCAAENIKAWERMLSIAEGLSRKLSEE